MTASASSKVVVLLIHGTFAKGAKWVEPEGTIRRALKDKFGGSITVDTIGWSGGNGFAARQEAAEKLRDRVAGEADRRCFVIAHSHAGNSVFYAARDPGTEAKLAGVVTLATPFIVARERNLGWTGKVFAQTLVLWLVLAIFYVIYSTGTPPSTWWQQVGLALGLVLLIELPGLFLVNRWAQSSAAFLEQLRHGSIGRERLFILRAVADEATGAISFFQFPSAGVTIVLGNLARFVDGFVRWSARVAMHPIRAIGRCLLWFLASLVPAGAAFWLTGSKLVLAVTIVLAACFSYGPMVFLLLGNVHLALVVAAGPMALVAAPIIMILAVTLLVFGVRFAIANIYLDISVEATPIGTYDVTLLCPSASENPDFAGGLLHSALYDDEIAVRMICDFIEGKLAAKA